MIKLIIATDLCGGIGVDGKLPWHLPTDLAQFKKLTNFGTVVMGRKTYESLPFYPKGLPNRTNVIISRTLTDAPGCVVMRSIEECIGAQPKNSDLWVIGGAEIYEQMISYVDELHITTVHNVYKEANVRVKILKSVLEDFTLVSSKGVLDGKTTYSYRVYKRKEVKPEDMTHSENTKLPGTCTYAGALHDLVTNRVDYDSLELDGCSTVDNNTDHVVVDNVNPEFYSVYARKVTGEAVWIHDAPDHDKAVQFMLSLGNEHSLRTIDNYTTLLTKGE